jgi:hypothetical protein
MHIDVSLLAASAAYALALEPVRPWYERHRLTAATVAGGVALTGLALDRALRRELPHETRQRVMGHYWRLFAVAGLPIVTWQALILGKDWWEWEALWRG